jgi:VWFA-related protein
VDRSPSRRRALWLTAGALCTLAKAQPPAFSTSISVVNVLVTVRDKQGRLVRGLVKDDFTLAEDGRLQTIRYFSPQADQPLMLGLLVDISGSQRTVLAEQRRASRQFLDKILRQDDQAFLLVFDRQIQWVAGLTIPEPDMKANDAQGTALYDAILAASRRISGVAGRKAIIVFSDGYDTASAATLEAAVETAQRADALVYSIRFLDRGIFAFEVPESKGGSPVPREGRKALERIAKDTGGAYFDASAGDTLAKIYGRIEDQLRNQYSLGFTPVIRRPGYRKIRVSVKRNGLTVQARDGYYSVE